MATIPVVGKCFADPKDFLTYLEGLHFNLWRPRFVTVHHTGSPDLKTWNGWQTRPKPVTDEQWMANLGVYYATAVAGVKSAWSAGPHFFVTPKHICVLSPPTERGVHAASFNSVSWGVEAVGNFDSEKFEGPVYDNLVAALAVMHIAAALQPAPFNKGVRGLHFHRDDPLTKKTCPGKNVKKDDLIEAVEDKIAAMTGGEDPSDVVKLVKAQTAKKGVVNTDGLNVRATASGKAPVLGALAVGTKVAIVNEAMNGSTRWLGIEFDDQPGWISATFVTLS